ncbi:MAG: hypothetical protein O2899_02470, partial [Bacteroidetes bacterium]|nr:hypothetical protein [Bacteroidota bacterium]
MTPASRRHILLLLLLIPVGTAMAQTSASHRVVVGIEPITVMAISGDPMPLFGVLEPGRTTTVQDATTYYNLTTNVDRVHLEARLEEPLPPGVQLQLWVESSIGSSLGGVRLDDS